MTILAMWSECPRRIVQHSEHVGRVLDVSRETLMPVRGRDLAGHPYSHSPDTSPDGNDLLMTSNPFYQLRHTPRDVFSLFYGFCWCALSLTFYVQNGKHNYAERGEEAKS